MYICQRIILEVTIVGLTAVNSKWSYTVVVVKFGYQYMQTSILTAIIGIGKNVILVLIRIE